MPEIKSLQIDQSRENRTADKSWGRLALVLIGILKMMQAYPSKVKSSTESPAQRQQRQWVEWSGGLTLHIMKANKP